MTSATILRQSDEYQGFRRFVEEYLEGQDESIEAYPSIEALKDALSEGCHWDAADEDINIDDELAEREAVLALVWEDLTADAA
ncbi:MAG: hypothetical protein GX771_10915 [Halomonadaceae bacterium]|nr:hypothetical protein [Halomonadaceae bacterium]